MAKKLTIDAPAWQVWVGALALVLTGALLAFGVGFAGYFFGMGEGAKAAPAPTALAERTYTSADLAGVAAQCGIDAGDVAADAITLPHDRYGNDKKTCVMVALDPPARVLLAWNGGGAVGIAAGDKADWGNATASWKSNGDDGRDLTVRIEAT